MMKDDYLFTDVCYFKIKNAPIRFKYSLIWKYQVTPIMDTQQIKMQKDNEIKQLVYNV